MSAKEVNFDGIVGPTHNYSGLSKGNLASTTHSHMVSSPKKAALQGLKKMKYLHDLGIPQAVLPPQDRPHIPTLKKLGFEGDDATLLKTAFEKHPELFYRCCSASSMWAANAATATPSSDTEDKRLHITPANLSTMFHRSIEPEQTLRVLNSIFFDSNLFHVHSPLPAGTVFTDEGAANHTRLCKDYGTAGLHLFTYGRSVFKTDLPRPAKYPARQSLETSHAIERTHKIFPKQSVFLQQSPEAIDAGVFHNDVISVGDRNILLVHEKAYVNQEERLELIDDICNNICNFDLKLIEIKEKDLSLSDAVSSYFFNSQIVKLPDGSVALLAPVECREIDSTLKILTQFQEDPNSPFDSIHYLDIRESMSNGGGPGCLRLRIAMTESEFNSMNQGIIFTDGLYNELVLWVEKYYRDSLDPQELVDAQFLRWNQEALDALTRILKLGSIYEFQR